MVVQYAEDGGAVITMKRHDIVTITTGRYVESSRLADFFI